MAVYDGRLYVCGEVKAAQGVVFCLDAKTGACLWSKGYAVKRSHHAQWGSLATPTVSGDCVFTLTKDNHLRIWNRLTGAVVGARGFATPFSGHGASPSPLVIRDRVILGAGAYGVAVDRRDPGRTFWGDLNARVRSGYASPTLCTFGGVDYAAIIDSKNRLTLTAVDGDGNAPVTSFDLSPSSATNIQVGIAYQDPVPYGADQLFVGGTRGVAMLRVSPGPTLSVKWFRNSWPNTPYGLTCCYMNCVIVGNGIYGVGRGTVRVGGKGKGIRHFSCLNASDGSTRWTRNFADEGLKKADGTPTVAMIAVGGHIVLLHESGKLNVMKASSLGFDVEGRPWIDAFPSPDPDGEYASPVVADGLLYCRSVGGHLVCYQVGDRCTAE
jgi:outer membrane protein assembly factor BamB